MKFSRDLMVGVLLGVLVGCSPPNSPRTKPDPDSRKKTSSPTEDTEVAKKPVEADADKKADVKPKAAPAPNPLVSKTALAGLLQGEVVWQGQMPAATEKAEECFVMRGGKKVPVTPPVAVRVDPSTHGVAGVMVWLAKAPAGASVADPAPMSLFQSHGKYHPQAKFVLPGTLLHLRTTDDSADFQGSGVVRFSRSLHRGEDKQVTLSTPGLLTIRSTEHPWMAPAYVRVLEHDYSAITTAEGKFELPYVPPAEYRVILWHPAAGKGNAAVEVSVPVKLAAKEGANIRWTLPQK